MLKLTRCLGAIVLALLLLPAWSATTGYSMKIVVSKPKGSAGEKLAATLPSATAYTPCNATETLDALTFKLTYAAGSSAEDFRDVYLLFLDPAANLITSAPFYMIAVRPLADGGAILVPRFALDEIDPDDDMYLAAEDNLGNTVTENLISSALLVDGVPLGTWQLVGIIADRNTVDFGDASTWDAWDVATVVLGQPWTSDAKLTCQ
jgi:hypothetical protein